MKKINKARYAGLITGVSAALIVCGVGLYVNISGADKSYAKTKETRITNENIVEEIDFSAYTEVPDNTEISEEYVPLYACIEQNFAAANSLDEEVAVALYEEDLQYSEC